MKALLTSLLLVVCVMGSARTLKEGDVIFQTSQSEQAPYIAYATFSNKTHCGIIIEKNSKLYVLETLNVIKLTPLDVFIERGLFKSYWVKRYTDKAVKIKYKQYLGIPYDLAFRFDNKKFYCSELVYEIYKTQLNVELCKPNKLSSYNLLGIKDIAKRRKMNLEQYVVAPSDLYDSKLLKKL